MKNRLIFLAITILSFQCFTMYAQSGMALSLDGIDDYMSVDDHDDIDIDLGENFTITLWIKTTAISNFYRIGSKRVAGNGAGYEMITQSGVGAYGINLRSTANTNSGPPFGNTVIADGSWHHLAMVIDGENNSASIYVDGNMEQISNTDAIGSESFANNEDLLFGTNSNQSNFMNTLLDDVRLWQVALSSTEIIADMTAIVNGPQANLNAAWDFENISGNTVNGVTGSHEGTLFGGASTIAINSTMVYQESTILTTSSPVGVAETTERVIAVNVVMQGNSSPLDLTEIKFNLAGTSNISDLENLKVYYTGSNPKLTTDALFGDASVQTGVILSNGNQTLGEGSNHFWITADISADAQEGNVIRGELESITVDGQEFTPAITSTSDERLIILENKLLFSGGDFGSLNWRIPAITTAADGSLIISADARINGPGDLPNNNDIVIRRSTDMGDTWSDALTIADFGQSGASDPALVLDQNTGDLLCMFATHSGLFQSTFSNPIRFQVCRSQDNGLTWSLPQDFTNQIYDPSWSAAWLASGNAHQLRSGRIVGAIGVRENTGNSISNFMIFSDDGGQSWDYNPSRATSIGNEAKIVELDNGNLMMNIRNQSPNLRQIVISDDGGESWGPPSFQPELIDPYVNGDLIRYTSVLDGYEKSRLLFSIAAHPTSRQNLTIFMSYDEGETWSISKSIYSGASGYSSLTVLSDGTIGCFYEDGEYENYQLYFARFSLDWLSDSNDSYLQPTAVEDQVFENMEIEIFPNPTDTSIKVEFDLKENMDVRAVIVNVSGQEVKEIINKHLHTGKHQYHIDMNGFSNGVYFIQIQVDKRLTTRKIIVLE